MSSRMDGTSRTGFENPLFATTSRKSFPRVAAQQYDTPDRDQSRLRGAGSNPLYEQGSHTFNTATTNQENAASLGQALQRQQTRSPALASPNRESPDLRSQRRMISQLQDVDRSKSHQGKDLSLYPCQDGNSASVAAGLQPIGLLA